MQRKFDRRKLDQFDPVPLRPHLTIRVGTANVELLSSHWLSSTSQVNARIMRAKTIAVFVFLILVALGTGVYVNWSDRKEGPEPLASTTRENTGAGTGFGLHPNGDVQDPDGNPPQLQASVLGEVDQASIVMLQAWLDDVFLATFEAPETIMRTNFVSVDARHIELELTRSLQAAQIHGENTEASTTLKLFSDRVYEIVVNKYRLGSTGFTNFGASIVGATGLGREYFQFEIAPDGRVFGRGVTAAGVYMITPTSDPAVLLVVEIDEKVVSKSITIE